MTENNNSLQSLFSCLLKKEAAYYLSAFCHILFFTVATQGILLVGGRFKSVVLLGVGALLAFTLCVVMMAKRFRDYLSRESFQKIDTSQLAVLVPSFLQIKKSINKWALFMIVCFALICIPFFGSIFAHFFICAFLALFTLPKDKIRPFLQKISEITVVQGVVLFALALTTSLGSFYVGICALLSLYVPPLLIAKAVPNSGKNEHLITFMKMYSLVWLGLGVLLFLFIYVPFWEEYKNTVVALIAIYELFVYPITNLCVLRPLSMKKTIKTFVDKTSSAISRDCIIGSGEDAGNAELFKRSNSYDVSDCVRESDGYYRVCLPQYFNENPQKFGEYGYLASPEEDTSTFPSTDGSWVVFRNLSSVTNVLHTRKDEIGASCRGTLSALVGSLLDDVYNASDKRYFNDLLSPWIMRVWSGNSTKDYLKTPWESGEILGVPILKNLQFQYPLGCGIVDQETIPCGARLTVQISLKKELVGAVERVSNLSIEEYEALSPSNPDVKLLRSFVDRFNLIVPSVYEAFFVKVLESVKQLYCFLPDEEKTKNIDQVFQEEFFGTEDFSKLLPEGVAELVNVSIRDARVTQLIVTPEQFKIFSQLELLEKERKSKYFEEMKKLDKNFTDLILRGATERGEESSTLQDALDRQFKAIFSSVEQGRDLLSQAISTRGNQNSPKAMEDLQATCAALTLQVQKYQNECRTLLSEMVNVLSASSRDDEN